MNFVLIIILASLVVIVLILLLQWKQLSQVTNKTPLLASIMTYLDALQALQERFERSLHEQMLQNRQEQANESQALRGEVTAGLAAIGDSLSIKIDSLIRSNDQKLELFRSGIEQRQDAFRSEWSEKIETLTQSIDLKFLALSQGMDQKLSHVEMTLCNQAQGAREENALAWKNLSESIINTMTGIFELQKNQLQDLRATIDSRLQSMQTENERKLEQMRQTVDEKLQGTLEARLGESFKQVSDRLEQVYRGLGEMQSLAAGVGDLKRVLTNVKNRGTWGEIQLGALLEQILAPEQYARNVATANANQRVEYAVKLPGRDGTGEPVWLPVDAKFPMEDYQRLVEAWERADAEAAEQASRQLELTLKACARNISEKYLAPPRTTDFGILFLPTESLYAEAMRRPGLAESLQREYRVALAGPSTLAALLNSLQMGFRTLAIQQRSSEVWEVLGAVKAEFSKYAGVLAKIKSKLTEAQNTVEKAETRTRVIQRKLRSVETLGEQAAVPASSWLEEELVEAGAPAEANEDS